MEPMALHLCSLSRLSYHSLFQPTRTSLKRFILRFPLKLPTTMEDGRTGPSKRREINKTALYLQGRGSSLTLCCRFLGRHLDKKKPKTTERRCRTDRVGQHVNGKQTKIDRRVQQDAKRQRDASHRPHGRI